MPKLAASHPSPIQISNRATVAIHCLMTIAARSERSITAKELTSAQNLQPRSLETTLQALAHAHLLKSVRGPNGGYQLAKPANEITLGHIFAYAERLDRDSQRANPPAETSTPSTRLPTLDVILNAATQHAAKITLQQLIADSFTVSH